VLSAGPENPVAQGAGSRVKAGDHGGRS
jgi:hypothetical protein